MFSLNSLRRSNSSDFFLQARVEAGVLQGDADVAGEGFEQFHVFAGQEVAAQGAAEADDGDGAAGGVLRVRKYPGTGSAERLAAAFAGRRLGHAARQIVVQVEKGRGALLFRGQMHSLLGVFEEDVRVILGAVEVEEAEIQVVLRTSGVLVEFFRQAVRGREAQATGFTGKKDGDARHKKRARQLLDDGVEQRMRDRSRS